MFSFRDRVYSNVYGKVVVDTSLLWDGSEWETMVFKADKYGCIASYTDLYYRRCKGTEADAKAMHKAVLEYIKGL